MKASSLILINSKRKIILQLRDNKDGVYFRGCWGLIGGAAINNESPRECIIRECEEEIGWRPDNLRRVMEMNEHCQESVFVSFIESEDLLCCNEGVRLQSFTYEELDRVNISSYHKKIIKNYNPIVINSANISQFKVLFYTKVLPPAFGGYVVAGMNLYNVFSNIANIHLVTDDDIISLDANADYDLLMFNATYENTDVFEKLSKRCKLSWSYEHNSMTEGNIKEINYRFESATRILVPSDYLKQKITCVDKASLRIEPTVLPIPVDSCTFSFHPHIIGAEIRFITCCALKAVRNLEFTLGVMKELRSLGLSFHWDIYGETPYGGDYAYYEKLCNMVDSLLLSKFVSFHSALRKQQDISEALHKSDFYIDFATKETYGIAKIEAVLSGTRLIVPLIDNNAFFKDHSIFYSGTQYEIAAQIKQTINDCRKNPEKDISLRRCMSESVKRFDYISVSETLKKILYETV